MLFTALETQIRLKLSLAHSGYVMRHMKLTFNEKNIFQIKIPSSTFFASILENLEQMRIFALGRFKSTEG